MSEIQINILDANQTISGTLHGSFGDVLVASLTAEPETIEELEIAVERFIKRESDWSVFRSFRKTENFEPYDAGLLVIDLVGKVILADTTYSYYSTQGKVRIKSDTDEDFSLPYQLSDDWKHTRGLPEFEGMSASRREYFRESPPFDAREILFGKPLFDYIIEAYTENKDSDDEDLFTNIHAKWLMTERSDLRNKTPRGILLEKTDFIESDLHSRSIQWSFTSVEPPPISKESKAYKFAGFGRHEIVMYYDLVRFLLGICFENGTDDAEILAALARDWLNNPQIETSGRTPASIIEKERQRINLTVTAEECLIDDDCPMCQMMAVDFIDTPTFCHYDGSHFEFDRFEFSFHKVRADWEKEQREYEEMSRKFDEKYKLKAHTDDNFFDENQLIN